MENQGYDGAGRPRAQEDTSDSSSIKQRAKRAEDRQYGPDAREAEKQSAPGGGRY